MDNQCEGGDMKEELRVYYKIEAGIDGDFDATLADVARQNGWYFYGSGFNHKTGRRSLVFDHEEVTDVPRQDSIDIGA